MNVAIVVGHTNKKQGAKTLYGKTEYSYNKEVATHLGVDFLEYKSDLNYFDGCSELKGHLDGYDLVLHLHFNSFSSIKASGCEAIYWKSNKFGESLADLYIKTISEYYDTNPRESVPMIDKSQRGYWALRKSPCTTLILEPFFGSNKECYKFKDTLEHAKVLALFIQDANKLWRKLHQK